MIKNIIFDLGDVIINIDVPRAAQSFAILANISAEKSTQIIQDNEVFRKFESGILNEDSFRNYIRTIFENPNWTDETIDKTWNSLLLDIPKERIGLIQRLNANYRLFLLSNTSPIHIKATNLILEKTTGVEKLDDLFEHLFLSYKMGVMKPDRQIFEMVLSQADIKAEETLFLDDNADNVKASLDIGIQTIHVQKPTSIVEYLEGY